VQFNQGLVRPRGAAPDSRPVFAEEGYRRLLHEQPVEEAVRLRAETRLNYIAEMNRLLDLIHVPVVLLYWSTRPPDYTEGIGTIGDYWGEFPHFVNSAVITQVKDRADRYVEAVTRRGLPQLIVDRVSGSPLIMWPEDRFPGVQQRAHNHYYPSPEMHADAAEAILGALPVTPAPRLHPPRRDVLVHYHIFKNAGAAIDRVLQQYFGQSWAWLQPPDSGACMNDEQLVRLLSTRPDLSAVSSHQLRFPLRGGEGIRLHPVVMLRHPIDRVRSIYDYERMEGRQQSSQLIHTVQAGKLDFPDWVEWCLSEPGMAAPIANFQTRACSFRHNGLDPNDWAVPPDLTNLEEAMDLMSELPVVGVAEEFECATALLTARFGPLFPQLDFAGDAEGQRDAASPGDDRALDPNALNQRLAAIRQELGPALYLRLVQANELDLELYAQARRRLLGA
jgi:hypothetical protein